MDFLSWEFSMSLPQIGYGAVAVVLLIVLAYQTGYNRAKQLAQMEAVQAGVAEWRLTDHTPKATYVFQSPTGLNKEGK